MEKDLIKAAVKEAIVELMASPEGRQAFGPLMMDAVGQWIGGYMIEMEKHHPDGTIERVKQPGDILAHISEWIKNSEGAIRGCQADAAAARNRAAETRDIMAEIAQRAAESSRVRLIETEGGP